MAFKRFKTATFAFDTENLVMLDGKVIPQDEMKEALKDLSPAEMRARVSCKVWAWQIFDELNGFYMTDNFEEFLNECCLRGYKFGWCYNSTFDFSQIDYQILALGKDKWKWHEKRKVGYDRGQPWTYTCLQNDMGARYSYKLWVPYKAENRHVRTHAFEIRDFMKFCVGGLDKVLEDLDVRDNEGNPLRKLKMNYQAVKIDDLTDEERAYCEMDVKGLYFAVKQFNETIEEISEGECHIFGKETNLLTSGGLSKKMLLKTLYPDCPSWKRLNVFQRQHPLTAEQDRYLRDHKLYRGGITFLNPRYKGKMIKKPMYRYDVNSEYPYAMSQINSLCGEPYKIPFSKWLKMKKAEREKFEAIYVITSISGDVKPNMLGVFYDPFERDFINSVDIRKTFLMFERELNELAHWYELEFTCEHVIVCPKGEKIYAPFIEKYYPLKSQATSPTMRKVIKLILNSAYGKLAQRIEVVEGRYMLNPDTGCVRYEVTGESEEEKSRMSVLDGALVTAFARCYILSKIREICPNPSKDFVYIDTDSIHCFNEYKEADDKALGALKCEMITERCKYLLPKTYVDIKDVGEAGKIPLESLEIHSKGISVKAIYDDLVIVKKKGKKKICYIMFDKLNEKFAFGKKFTCLQAMNVKGGKALVPVEKYLARPELAPKGFDEIYSDNMEGKTIYGER